MSSSTSVQPPPVASKVSWLSKMPPAALGAVVGVLGFLLLAEAMLLFSAAFAPPSEPGVAQSLDLKTAPPALAPESETSVIAAVEEGEVVEPAEQQVAASLAQPTESFESDGTIVAAETTAAGESDLPAAPNEEAPQPTFEVTAPSPPVAILPKLDLPPIKTEPDDVARISEQQLFKHLANNVPELDVHAESRTFKEYWTLVQAEQRTRAAYGQLKTRVDLDKASFEFEPITDLLAARTDLSGMPLRMGHECRTSRSAAKMLQVISRSVRTFQADQVRARGQSRKAPPDAALGAVGDYEFAEFLRKKTNWLDKDAVGAFEQMLQAEGKLVRLQLLDILSSIDCEDATIALARRALFDHSAEVRSGAIERLKQRPAEDARQTLVGGFRYPWAPVADHAADAMIQLDDQDAVGNLVDLLDDPDPQVPFKNREGEWVVNELVRVNHMRNCVLCHAPSLASSDPVRGLVPVPGQPMPVVYYQNHRGNFVRADITYLKQDFSITVNEVAADVHPWPVEQRYDYFIRTRKAEYEELGNLLGKKLAEDQHATYPQRDAVLRALRKLTGTDRGVQTEAWRRFRDKEWVGVRHWRNPPGLSPPGDQLRESG